MKKYFLYDPGSIKPAAVKKIDGIGYQCNALTDDPEYFWKYIADLSNESVLLLISHGDKDGPLPIKGTDGTSIDLEKFAKCMADKKLKLYMMSCETGNDPCYKALTLKSVNFVAPVGDAAFFYEPGVGLYFKSLIKGTDTSAGWVGPLTKRGSTIYLP